jgi:hypothetical protein
MIFSFTKKAAIARKARMNAMSKRMISIQVFFSFSHREKVTPLTVK